MSDAPSPAATRRVGLIAALCRCAAATGSPQVRHQITRLARDADQCGEDELSRRLWAVLRCGPNEPFPEVVLSEEPQP